MSFIGIPRWHLNHTTELPGWIAGLHWINHKHLALCMTGSVMVYEVTTSNSYPKYRLTSKEWRGKRSPDVTGVAVTESLQDSMLVICQRVPYVYQYPCREATSEEKKYKILGENVDPYCIVANANNVAVDVNDGSNKTLVTYSLPNFVHQFNVETSSFNPIDLSISPYYLVVAGVHKMVVKVLGDVTQDVCEIKPPEGFEFQCVSVTNNAREIYAGVHEEGGEAKRFICKYVWNGVGKPRYVNAGCVVDDLECVSARCLSVTTDGLLAVGQCSPPFIFNVQVYHSLKFRESSRNECVLN